MQGKIKNNVLIAAILSLPFVGCNNSSPTGGATPTWQTVFSDDFNRADGLIGANYAPEIYYRDDSTNPTQSSNAAFISNNRVRLAGWSYYSIRYVTGVPNEFVKVSVKCNTATAPSGNYGIGLEAKSRGLGNGGHPGASNWVIQEGYVGYIWLKSAPLVDSSFGILKYTATDTAGVPPALISRANTIKRGGSYLLELTINKQALTFVVTDLSTNVAQTTTVTDTGSMLAGDTVSFDGWQENGDTTYFDDFKIEKYE